MSWEATCTEPSRCTVAVGEAIFHRKVWVCAGGLCAETTDARQANSSPEAMRTRSCQNGPVRYGCMEDPGSFFTLACANEQSRFRVPVS